MTEDVERASDPYRIERPTVRELIAGMRERLKAKPAREVLNQPETASDDFSVRVKGDE